MARTTRNRQQRLNLTAQQLHTAPSTSADSPYNSSAPSTPSQTQHQYAAASMLRLHQGHLPIPTEEQIRLNNSVDDGYSNNDTDSSETVNAITNIINVCNDVDKEGYCQNTELAVKTCIRQHIWCNNKFLTDKTMKTMNISDRTNPHSIINVLLKYTRRERISDVHRFRFWKKYGPLVQKELNTMKTIATRAIRTALMPGKSNLDYQLTSQQLKLTYIYIILHRIRNGTCIV